MSEMNLLELQKETHQSIYALDETINKEDPVSKSVEVLPGAN